MRLINNIVNQGFEVLIARGNTKPFKLTVCTECIKHFSIEVSLAEIIYIKTTDYIDHKLTEAKQNLLELKQKCPGAAQLDARDENINQKQGGNNDRQ